MLVFHNINRLKEVKMKSQNLIVKNKNNTKGKRKKKWSLLLPGFIVQWSYQFVSKEIVVPLLEKNCKVITDLSQKFVFLI